MSSRVGGKKGMPQIMKRYLPHLLAVGTFAVGIVLGASRSAPQQIMPVADHLAHLVTWAFPCSPRRREGQGCGGESAPQGSLRGHLQEAQHIISADWFQYYRDHVMK